MLIDKTRIGNMALANLGEPPVQSLTQQGKAALAIKQRYDEARLIALSSAPWGFALGWRVGTALAVDPKPGWTYAFSYPADALKVFYIDHADGTSAPPFAISDRNDNVPGKMISTNEAGPTFIYTRDKEDVTTFDWEFVHALAWLLASMVAMPITKSKKLETDAFNRWMALKTVAEAGSRNENIERTDADDLGFYNVVR